MGFLVFYREFQLTHILHTLLDLTEFVNFIFVV